MDISILIPARNEMFLAKTIEDILQHSEADTEVIAVMDGKWSDPPVEQNERVNVIYLPVSIGQRAATNLACRIAKGKYVAKVDAHCSFNQGFDRVMIEGFKKMGDDCTMVPTMRNLHAFDWKCHRCGYKKYQGPTPTECPDCVKKGIPVKDSASKFKRKMIWYGKPRPQSNSYCFDSDPHFQYFNDYTRRSEYERMLNETGGFTETMSLQGSFFMMTKERYVDLNICDESFGSWGSQGIEVAVKSWLSGGRVFVNHNTWYAHMFRTQGGDFSFPYPMRQSQVVDAKNKVRELFYNKKWEGQVLPLSWLVELFWPVNGWHDEDLIKLKQGELREVTAFT